MEFYRESPWENKNPEEFIREWKNKVQKHLPRHFRGPFAIVFLILILFLIKGSVYTIQPNEVGVVLRFGRFVRMTEPGFHLKLPSFEPFPFAIEKVYPVKVEYNYKEEFGFRTISPGVRSRYSSKSYDDESLILTGDLNVLDLEWIVQYKVKDPYKVLFKVRDVRKALRDLSESVMREVVGDDSFNQILTAKGVEINDKVQQQLQKVLDSYDTGLNIITVKLQDVNPPDPVKPAFNEVNEAKQEREKMINQAWEVYNKRIPEAKGKARKMIAEAEGYKLERINKAKGESRRFLLLREAYAKAREVTRRRLYLEEMRTILSRAGKKYVVDPEEKGILPLLQLER